MRIDVFMGYVLARFNRDLETRRYREYLAQAVNNINQGKYIQQEWSDIANPSRKPDKDPEEILSEVIEKTGLVI